MKFGVKFYVAWTKPIAGLCPEFSQQFSKNPSL